MPWWKIAALVALVVLPGGSLVLVAVALYRAYRSRSGSFGQNFRVRWAASMAALGRLARPFATEGRA